MTTHEKPYQNLSDVRTFSMRLAAALEAAGFDHDIAGITRRFNFLTPSATVTVHAVRKWLSGKSIPTQERLRTLALLVGVTPEWLRYGRTDDADTRESSHFDHFPERWRAVAFDLALLDAHHHKIAEKFVELLLAKGGSTTQARSPRPLPTAEPPPPSELRPFQRGGEIVG